MKILIVEDYPELRRAIDRTLTGYKMRVYTPSRLGAVLTAIRQGEPDLILTDYLLTGFPESDRAASKIVEAARKASIPCVVYTGTPDWVDEDTKKTAAAVLQKPVPFHDLLGAFVAALEKPE